MQEQSRAWTSRRALATHCQGEMKDYSESGHGRKRNRQMMCCITMGAAPGSSQKWNCQFFRTKHSSHPGEPKIAPDIQCALEPYGSLHWLPLKALCSDWLSSSWVRVLHTWKTFLRNSFTMLKENLWVQCYTSFPPCGNFSQSSFYRCTSLFRPYRIHIKILLPANFGIY